MIHDLKAYAAATIPLLLLMLSVGCGAGDDQTPDGANSRRDLDRAFAVGTWRAELGAEGVTIPFSLHVFEDGKTLRASVVNGPEVIGVPELKLENDRLRISFPHYDSEILARRNGDYLSGEWSKRRGGGEVATMSFLARRNDDKATTLNSRSLARDGNASKFPERWRVEFESSKEPAVGIFRVSPSGSLNGTFLTTTGDYRYLSGRLEGDHFSLSCFDGAHAFVFNATLRRPDEKSLELVGAFRSGATWNDPFRATPDENIRLSDGFRRSEWVKGVSLADLEFPDLEGQLRRLDDSQFEGKARLIQVFGSWCPNCHDAAQFTKELLREYRKRGLSVLGVAFELTGDQERSARQVKRYLKRNQIDYPVLIGGLADKASATKAFRGLDFIRSYPTTIFLDAENRVRGVYSGFDGPSTGPAHDALRASFRALIDEILADG